MAVHLKPSDGKWIRVNLAESTAPSRGDLFWLDPRVREFAGFRTWGALLNVETNIVDAEPWGALDPILHEVAHLATLPPVPLMTSQQLGHYFAALPEPVADRLELAAWVVEFRVLRALSFDITAESAAAFATGSMSMSRIELSRVTEIFHRWASTTWSDRLAFAVMESAHVRHQKPADAGLSYRKPASADPTVGTYDGAPQRTRVLDIPRLHRMHETLRTYVGQTTKDMHEVWAGTDWS